MPHRRDTARCGGARPRPSTRGAAPGARGLRQLILVSLFNPAAWLDTVLVIGAVGVGLAPEQRLGYAAGAAMASLAWFTAWVWGARGARGWMDSPANWRRLDIGIALAMFGMAAWLAREV